jgi:hypothetical protein
LLQAAASLAAANSKIPNSKTGRAKKFWAAQISVFEISNLLLQQTLAQHKSCFTFSESLVNFSLNLLYFMNNIHVS